MQRIVGTPVLPSFSLARTGTVRVPPRAIENPRNYAGHSLIPRIEGSYPQASEFSRG